MFDTESDRKSGEFIQSLDRGLAVIDVAVHAFPTAG